MCKDQHGCRFLQKKLDEMNTQTVDIIFNEVYPHFAELMTGKFYYCAIYEILGYSHFPLQIPSAIISARSYSSTVKRSSACF